MKYTGRKGIIGLFRIRLRAENNNIFKTSHIFILVTVLLISLLSVKSTNGQYNNPGYPPGYNMYPQQSGYPNQGIMGLGLRDYGDECQNPQSVAFRQEDSKACDPARGLYCGYNFRCLCVVPGSIYRSGKCRARVGRSCQGADSTTIECVINAECNTSTRFCQCRRSYWSNDEGTACVNHGYKLTTMASPSLLIGFFGFLTIFQLYRHTV